MRLTILACFILLAGASSAVGSQSTDCLELRAPHSVVILTEDGAVLADVALGIQRGDDADSLQTFSANERGSFEIPFRFQSGKYHFTIRRSGALVREFDLTIEPAYDLGRVLTLQLRPHGGTDIELTGAWIHAEPPSSGSLSTVPPP